MKNDKSEEYANLALKKFYDNTTDNIQTSAIVNRALTDKISTETINQKVNNQLRSIYAQMNKINPKFNETSKNYGIIKQEILDVLTDYELALTELCDYYDKKLEELILKKVELESHYVGKLFKEENLIRNKAKKVKLKEYDSLKLSFSNKAKNISDNVSLIKQTNKSIQMSDIRYLKDLIDLENEQINNLEKKLSNIQKEDIINQDEIKSIENQINNISQEIKKMNEEKKVKIEEAMETKDKWISTIIKKTSIWSRAKNFFINRFNTINVVSNTVINPLKIKIKEFRTNDLLGLKG